MSEWIRIRIKDFYKDAIGEPEYAYVTKEVYEVLANSFRKEEHAREMMDRRYRIKDAYVEGETEEIAETMDNSLEDEVIRQMDIEILRRAIDTLTELQKKRLYLYFFEGMSFRQIGKKLGVSDMAIRYSIEVSIKKIKKFFN